jgi:adenylate cyclase
VAEERVKRKLTAILSADVKGYSRLMGEDEVSTMQTLKKYREAMARLVQEYEGRVIDSPGDNILAEFRSVVDAVECAVKLQKELKERNAKLSEHRRMEFRIGVNLGDVIDDEGRIYGDGVNVASRVEGLAEGGGICISGTAFDQIGKKLPLGYEYLGEQEVKNIEKPVRVYKILTEPEAVGKLIGEEKPKPKGWRWVVVAAARVILVAGVFAVWNFYLRPDVEPASVEKMAFPLPDKPSIAVLPFDNLSGDPEQEYIADGITENIISALSKIPEIFVIARNSTFVYKGKPVKVQQAAEELGVKYILEGSVQKSSGHIRITAQLIDATAGYHIWSEKYDQKFDELFRLVDNITRQIVVALQVELTQGEQSRVWHETTNNFDAWGYGVKAYSHFERYNKADNAKARDLFQKAVQLDPDYAFAWMMLAFTHWVDARFGFSESRAASFKQAVELAQKALSLDDTLPDMYTMLGSVHLFQKQHEKALALGRKATTLGPSNSEVHALFAMSLLYAGKFEEAIENFQKAMRLSPYYPTWYLYQLAESYYMAGRYEDAATTYGQGLELAKKGGRNPFLLHAGLAAAYFKLGQEDEARQHAEEVLKINPKFSLEYMRNFTFYKGPDDTDRLLNAMRKAGLPETPPLPLPNKPSIAVLPFTNMSDDPGQEYFSDGITEEIITALSKTPKLFVIARTSSFKYKGKEVDVRTVGRELGVRYVLEGSVRRSKDQLRITAQLVDTKTGNHLWAERYDRGLKDIFALQDEITFKVIAALQVKLTEGEQALITAWGTDNFEAYAKLLKGTEYGRRFNREGNLLARKMAEEVIALDPGYPQGYSLLGRTHMMDVWFGLTKSPRKSLAEAVRLYQTVIAMYPSAAVSRGLLGIVYTMMRQHEKGIAELEKAIALNPNVADNHAFFGFVLHLNGRHKEALVEIKKAIRLNPFPENFYFLYLGNAYMYDGMYDESIAAYKKALRVQPNNLFTHLRFAAVYSLLGREDEAHAEAAEVLRINPKFSLENFAKTIPFKNQDDTEHLINALRKAGLK